MRKYLLLSTTVLLAACGGGQQGVTSTPAPIAGGGGSTNPGTFVSPTQAKTYVGVGGSEVFQYSTDNRNVAGQEKQIYASNTTSPRNSGISISYDPASAVFTLKVVDTLSGASTDTRFQDPGSRTNFGGAQEPQWGAPKLANPNIQYLQAGDGDPLSPYSHSGSGLVNPGNNSTEPTGTSGSTYQSTTLFYLKPGAETQYVTYAGYVRNSLAWVDVSIGGATVKENDYKLERGAFAYGELTANNKVPVTGTGSYTGSMLGTMIFNPTLDGTDPSGLGVVGSYFQWLSGTSKLDVDFVKNTFQLALNGTVTAPTFDTYTAPLTTVLPAGATFTASGQGNINLVNFGGFKGQFQSAAFASTAGNRTVNVAGSTIDGAFYGPAGEEAGGAFHIVGGNPDERVDILGAFVGKK